MGLAPWTSGVWTRSTWRYVEQQFAKAAAGGDPADAAISLRLALMLEGVECRPR